MSRPQHHKAVRLRLASAALGLGAALALTGCSAGQMTETSTQVADVEGGGGEANGFAVRDAQLTFPTKGTTYPAGSTAPMSAVLVNENPAGDRLVQAHSPYAASIELAGRTDLPGQTALHAEGKPGSNPQQQTSQGGPLDQYEVQITLKGLTQEIGPGVTIPVTFLLEKAGPVTVQVPIGADPNHRPQGEPGGH